MGDTANFLTGFRKEVCAQSNMQLPDKLCITNMHSRCRHLRAFWRLRQAPSLA